MALELLKDVPPHIFLAAVADSSLRSIVQTMLYEVGDQLNLNPRYFSSIPGATFWDRVANFLAVIFSDPFMFLWAVGPTYRYCWHCRSRASAWSPACVIPPIGLW